MYYWYTDTLLHWRLLFHIFISSLHEDSIHSYFMFLYHYYIDSPVYMHWLSLYSCCMDHCLYYMNYCYMDIPIFSLHDCFSLLILIFSLLYMWAVDIRCVDLSATWNKATEATSRIPHLPFLIILYHAITRAHVLLSCYMYHALYLFLIHCVVLIY